MKFAFIHVERAYFPISALCRVLMELREQGLTSFDKCIGRRRTARIMQKNCLFARRCKAFRRCPATCDVARVAENLLARDFSASTPNSVWITDVKYVQTDQGWLYLATVLDLFSRHIIDLAMSEAHDGALARAAIENAAATRIRNRTLRIHSDRGGIYGEHEYVQRLSTLGIERSMSRASNPWDNAAMESLSARCSSNFFRAIASRSLRTHARQSPSGSTFL